MQGLQKYYIFSGSKEIFRRRLKSSWIQFFKIGSFLRIIFYSDGYINLKFSGICISKSLRGVGSTFQLADRSGVNNWFYFFSPVIKNITIVKF
jgi:ribosomal protein L19